ncbi:MAG: SMP-30/gluconolactonase/LRE family protein [Saprospiraceae bacterium]|nr:SMP-30/gluconolactonase/LRE family protein [Saprospiraceae bacterium]
MHPLLERATIFCEGLDHPECIAVHPDGSIWAGGESGQIYRISSDGSSVVEMVNTGGFILGIAISPGAEWMAICDLGKKCVWRLDLESLRLSMLSQGAEGHTFQIPNYPVFDAAGDLYVSESGAFRQISGKILKIHRDGRGQIWHNGPFNFANGMAMGPSGSELYVVCSWLPGVERVSISSDESSGGRSVYCTLPKTVPDGLAFDQMGNLYISCYAPNAIYRVSVDGTAVELIEDWEAHTLSNPTNIAFGGPDFDQLFSANLGRWHITKIDLGSKGLPLASHKPKPTSNES